MWAGQNTSRRLFHPTNGLLELFCFWSWPSVGRLRLIHHFLNQDDKITRLFCLISSVRLPKLSYALLHSTVGQLKLIHPFLWLSVALLKLIHPFLWSRACLLKLFHPLAWFVFGFAALQTTGATIITNQRYREVGEPCEAPGAQIYSVSNVSIEGDSIHVT